MKERLQKVLARAGVGSRRRCEVLIAERRVRVNGAVVDRPGVKVDPAEDEISVDGSDIAIEKPHYVLLYKPKGFVCSSRPERGKPSVVSLVKLASGERLFCVGRLDEESHGLLLLTNDGEFGNHLTHPRYGVGKTYRVSVKGRADGPLLAKIQRGVWLAEGKTAPARVQVVKRLRELSILKITLSEGRNRHLRRVFARLGLPVIDILRVQIGPLALGRMRPGEWRELLPREVEQLRNASDARARPAVAAPVARDDDEDVDQDEE